MTDISGDLMVFAYNYGTAAHDDLIKIIDKLCSIDEEELDELAECFVDSFGCQTSKDGEECYKAGYRKAMEG